MILSKHHQWQKNFRVLPSTDEQLIALKTGVFGWNLKQTGRRPLLFRNVNYLTLILLNNLVVSNGLYGKAGDLVPFILLCEYASVMCGFSTN